MIRQHKLLQEADKSRFFNSLWDEFSADNDLIQKDGVTYQQLLNFVNKDDPLLKKQFQLRNVDWQKGSDAAKWTAICQAYIERDQKQKSNEMTKAVFKQDNILSIIIASGLQLVDENEEARDCDFVHLNDLDNEKFTFVVPMTYEAAVFCDSVECGGEGAKWCIGYKRNDDYWQDYIQNGNLFILAFNSEAFKKGKNREKDTLKYMIQICPDGSQTQAWLQCDDPDGTIHMPQFKKFFGRSAIEMVESFANRILCDDNIYSANSQGDFYDIEDQVPTYPWDDSDLSGNILDYYNFLDGEYDIDNGPLVKQLIYDIAYNDAIFDGNGEKIDTFKMTIGGAFNKGVFDIPTFCDWLEACGVTNAYGLTIRNASIKKLVHNPKRSDNSMTVHIENCEIDDFVYEDYTNDIEFYIDDTSTIKNAHILCSDQSDCDEDINLFSHATIYKILKEKTNLKRQNCNTHLFEEVLSEKEKLDERGNSSVVMTAGVALAVAACAFGVKSCQDNVADKALKNLGCLKNYEKYNIDGAGSFGKAFGIGDTQSKAMYATIVSIAREKGISIKEAAELATDTIGKRLSREIKGVANGFKGRVTGVSVVRDRETGERVVRVDSEYDETCSSGSGENSRIHRRIRTGTVYIPVSEGNQYGIDDNGKSMNIGNATFIYESAKRRIRESRAKISRFWPIESSDVLKMAAKFNEGITAEVDHNYYSNVELLKDHMSFGLVQLTAKGYFLYGNERSFVYEGTSLEELHDDVEDLLENTDI